MCRVELGVIDLGKPGEATGETRSQRDRYLTPILIPMKDPDNTPNLFTGL